METKLHDIDKLPAGYLHLNSSEPELTGWFSGDVKPVRDGVYQVKNGTEIPSYQKWNDEYWCVRCKTILEAARWEGTPSNHQEPTWRGLAKDPNQS